MGKITEYSPFPYGFRGDIKDGAFCELDAENGTSSKFIVIRPRAYMRDKQREEQFVSDGVMSWNDIYPELKHLGYIPSGDDTFWLYTVDVCVIEKKYLSESDSEVFAKNAKDCEVYYFDDFNKCMTFLNEKFHVSETDFYKSWETNYPRF